MGIRLNKLQENFSMNRPLEVSCHVGQGLMSSFNAVFGDIIQENESTIVLQSTNAKMRLSEGEIYRVENPTGNGSFKVVLDGGSQLDFNPVR